jgi:hypothetical protein
MSNPLRGRFIWSGRSVVESAGLKNGQSHTTGTPARCAHPRHPPARQGLDRRRSRPALVPHGSHNGRTTYEEEIGRREAVYAVTACWGERRGKWHVLPANINPAEEDHRSRERGIELRTVTLHKEIAIIAEAS